jgi:hypothetical protein
MFHRKHHLSSPQKQIIEIMQAINFGRLEGLAVRDGEPVLDPLPRIVREIKFCAENSPRPEKRKEDFVLKKQVRALFEFMDEMQNGVIVLIEVKHGLPFRMEFEERAT